MATLEQAIRNRYLHVDRTTIRVPQWDFDDYTCEFHIFARTPAQGAEVERLDNSRDIFLHAAKTRCKNEDGSPAIGDDAVRAIKERGEDWLLLEIGKKIVDFDNETGERNAKQFAEANAGNS